MNQPTTYRSIFISDLHLGTKGCQADLLHEFLKNHSSEKLYLVGDIIDGWQLHKKFRWSQGHNKVVKQILSKSKTTEVFYVVGNHDEFLRKYLGYGLNLGNIRFYNEFTHMGLDGNKYLVVHGDLFDGISSIAKWISHLGDTAYTFLLEFNKWFNWFRHKFGMGYWSVSKYLKNNVKKALEFIFEFEGNLSGYCKKRGFDGVICGHIHSLELKTIDDVIYMNTGDWVESCSAIVEHHDGSWEAIHLDSTGIMKRFRYFKS